MTGLYDLADDHREEDDEDRELAEDGPEPDWDEDGLQQYKDDLAQGLIHEDGTQRDPGEPEWDAVDAAEYWKHRDEAHSERECDCPRPDWPGPEPGVVYSDLPPF